MVSDFSFLSWELLSSWLITYWLHSTICLGGLAIALRFTRVESFPMRELCWRVAMPLGFVTAMVALSCDSNVRINLADFRMSPDHVDTLTILTSAESIKRMPIAEGTKVELAIDPKPSPSLVDAQPIPNVGDTQPSISNAREVTSAVPSPLVDHAPASRSAWLVIPNWSRIACIAWLCVCVGCLMRWMINTWRLHRWLNDGRAHELLDDMMHPFGTRMPLRRQPRVVLLEVAQPFTVGWLRPTIVLPRRALNELSNDQLLALLAHELGHVQCGHAFWLHVLNLVCQFGFFQPLNLWANRCWRREAELMADSWATNNCVRPKQLASCLLQVATWQIMPRGAAMLQFMGRRRDALIERVECLIGQTQKNTKPPLGLTTRASWAIACATIGLALLGPKFSSASPHMTKEAGLSQQTRAKWLSVQQEWQALRDDILVLNGIANESPGNQSREQMTALLKQFEQIDRHYQEVQNNIDQEVWK